MRAAHGKWASKEQGAYFRAPYFGGHFLTIISKWASEVWSIKIGIVLFEALLPCSAVVASCSSSRTRFEELKEQKKHLALFMRSICTSQWDGPCYI